MWCRLRARCDPTPTRWKRIREVNGFRVDPWVVLGVGPDMRTELEFQEKHPETGLKLYDRVIRLRLLDRGRNKRDLLNSLYGHFAMCHRFKTELLPLLEGEEYNYGMHALSGGCDMDWDICVEDVLSTLDHYGCKYHMREFEVYEDDLVKIPRGHRVREVYVEVGKYSEPT